MALVAAGHSHAEILGLYPYLTEDDIWEALAYAAWRVEEVAGFFSDRVKLVIDMNLSPDWVPLLQQHHFEAVHWSSVGAGTAKDREIMRWARDNDSVIFTHDLDFGIILALTRAGASL